MKKGIIILVVILLGASFAYWKMQQTDLNQFEGIATVNGRLTLDRIEIATLYPGKIEEIYVNEGSDVEKDQVVAKLSSTQADAQLKLAEAQKQRALEAVKRAEAEINAYQQKVNLAKLELTNAQRLRQDRLISSTEVEKRQSAYQSALASIQAANAAKGEALAAVEQSDAQIQQVSDTLNDLLIKSPIAGRIEYKIADVGNVLPAGGKVVSVLDLTQVYINVFLPSFQSNQVRIGDDARIVVDGIDAVLPAKITYIATDAQFTPKSVETLEEREKLMFKVKLQIPVEFATQYPSLLKGGMTAVGYVKYDNQISWPENLEVKAPRVLL
ncbi:HlyD family efflux transporter periplasmic adaptor subunit [Otariodibacter sp.]|uniref:HlyD family secretion protein n=1 Tax=Otariodibacter sp. TaxID=3030919 RepID=UPI002635E6E7|nr:HlyD family efflux transporter periplasmic adaptor subunit [Otariodibacter sp.]